MPLLPRNWLLDACSSLTLAASGQVESILRTPYAGQTRQFVLSETVIAEAASLRRGGSGEDADVRDPLDWTPHFDSGLLLHTDAQNAQEEEHFVGFSQYLGDGEAMCLALATMRGWGVVTDDIVAQKRAGRVAILATPDLIKNWADVNSLDAVLLAGTLKRIRELAHYGPPRKHPLRTWWLDALSVVP